MRLIRLLQVILTLVLLVVTMGYGLPTMTKVAPAPLPTQQRKPFVLGISTTQTLPNAMYGQWSMTATLLDASAPDYFVPLIHDIWHLDQQGQHVVISNPVTGASAAITVDQVEGATASFHHVVSDNPKQQFSEHPTVKVTANSLSGTTHTQVLWLNKGQVTKRLSATYHLEGQRIGGPSVRFGQERSQESPLFEIEYIRPER
jgi:hypothetical protein